MEPQKLSYHMGGALLADEWPKTNINSTPHVRGANMKPYYCPLKFLLASSPTWHGAEVHTVLTVS